MNTDRILPVNVGLFLFYYERANIVCSKLSEKDKKWSSGSCAEG